MAGKKIKIFIASSAELKVERDRCIVVLNRLNKSYKQLDLEPVEWEYDVVHANYPGYKNIQKGINPKLQECELAVFLFYSKIGKYTREEFELANKENKRLFAFFKIGFSPGIEDHKSYGELLKFKASLNDTVLYIEYKDPANFENLLERNLNLYISENLPVVEDEVVILLSGSNLELIKLLAAKEEEIKTLKALNLPSTKLQLQLEQLVKEKGAISKELLQSEEIIKQQAKDKKALEQQLASQKENNDLKAKALEEVEKGDYSKAEAYLKESVEKSIDDTASTYYELAKIKNLQLQYQEAFYHYEQAAKIKPDNSLYLNSAGIMANSLKLFNKAIEYFEKALNIDLEYYGYNPVATHLPKKEYDKVSGYCELSLNSDLKYYCTEHPHIATDYNNLGTTYVSRGEYDKAINYYKEALNADLKIHGDHHPNIAIDYNNLGTVYDCKGENEIAIRYYKRSLSILKKCLSENHPNIQAIQTNLIRLKIASKNKADKY